MLPFSDSDRKKTFTLLSGSFGPSVSVIHDFGLNLGAPMEGLEIGWGRGVRFFIFRAPVFTDIGGGVVKILTITQNLVPRFYVPKNLFQNIFLQTVINT